VKWGIFLMILPRSYAATPPTVQADIFLRGSGDALFPDAIGIRAHLNVDDNADDALLVRYAAAAQQHIERITSHFLTPRVVTGTSGQSAAEYRLFAAPLLGISEIAVDSPDGPRDVAAEFVRADRHEMPTIVTLNREPLALEIGESLRVEAMAGYWPPPEPLVQAVLLLTGHFYRYREDSSPSVISAIPNGVAALCEPYRLRAFR
jgi:uncharacterized phiE125 gp8 family phage protein